MHRVPALSRLGSVPQPRPYAWVRLTVHTPPHLWANSRGRSRFEPAALPTQPLSSSTCVLQGNASQAAALLEAGVANLVAAGVHSCHQFCADVYILLGSAWRMLARSADSSTGQRKVAWGRVAMHSLLLGHLFQQAVQAGEHCTLANSLLLQDFKGLSATDATGKCCCWSTLTNSSWKQVGTDESMLFYRPTLQLHCSWGTSNSWLCKQLCKA